MHGEHDDVSSTMQPIVLVAFKDEGGLEGPVVMLCIERPSREVADSAAAGVPFAYEPSDATDLGWLSHAEATTVAADHGVSLTVW